MSKSLPSIEGNYMLMKYEIELYYCKFLEKSKIVINQR